MEKQSKLAGADFLAGLGCAGLGAWVVCLARDMKVFRTLIVSPGLFPLILGYIFVLCGVVLMIMAIKRGGLADTRRILSVANLAAFWRSPIFRRCSAILGMIILYVVLFGSRQLSFMNFVITVGGQVVSVNVKFILVTAGYLFATFMYLKAMKWGSALVVSLTAAIVVFIAFNQGFGIPIP